MTNAHCTGVWPLDVKGVMAAMTEVVQAVDRNQFPLSVGQAGTRCGVVNTKESEG